MLAELFTTQAEETEWLVPVLFRRAAESYERAGQRREAADCWSAAHHASRAAGLYLRDGDYARAAQTLFSEGRYAEALENYRRWTSLILPGSGDLVSARLGEAACLTLMNSDRNAARAAYHSARSQIEACDDLLREDGALLRPNRSLVAARLWETLGAYGLQVGRHDLLQLGYERALARYGEHHNTDRLRAARDYAAAIKGNRLLRQEVETRLAEWDKDSLKAKSEERRVLLDWQGRRFHQGDYVRLKSWDRWFLPEETNYPDRVYAHPGCTGSVVESAGGERLVVRWDRQKFMRLKDLDLAEDPDETITADEFFSRVNDEERKVMLDSFEAIASASHLDLVGKPFTRFWINHANRDVDGSPATLERREWVLIHPTIWEQRYADGEATQFEISGPVEVEGDHGTLVVKVKERAAHIGGWGRDTEISDPAGLEIFIPDRDSRNPWLKMRHTRASRRQHWSTQGEWRDIGEMHIPADDEPDSALEMTGAEGTSLERQLELVCPECSESLKAGTRVCYDCGHRFTLAESLVGTTLDAKYKLVEVLGSGDTTAVYRAIEQSGIGYQFALKVLLTPLMPERTAQRLSFAHVAETAMSLHHPGIVRVYDFKTTQLDASGPALPYFVMELVKGELLTDVLAGQVSAGLGLRALHLMRAICQAVGKAHRQSVMHLNLEPGCIFVLAPEWDEKEDSYHQRIKVMKFGYQQSNYHSVIDTFTGEMEGRPVMYMSPEKCQAHAGLNAQSDVYSLGVLLYEMVVGRPPFVAGTPLRIARQHLETPPPPFPPGLEVLPGVEAVVMKALSKDRNNRQADANALLAELEELLFDRRDV